MSKSLSEMSENLSKINFYGNAGKPAITEHEPIIYEPYQGFGTINLYGQLYSSHGKIDINYEIPEQDFDRLHNE